MLLLLSISISSSVGCGLGYEAAGGEFRLLLDFAFLILSGRGREADNVRCGFHSEAALLAACFGTLPRLVLGCSSMLEEL